MPRTRSIKPAFFDNEELGEADPILSLLFIGLWTLADREGRLEDRPKRIRKQLFGFREDVEVDALLDRLDVMGFVVRYQADGLDLLQVSNFAKHQRPHNKETESTLKGPSDAGAQKRSVQAPESSGEPGKGEGEHALLTGACLLDTGTGCLDTGTSSPDKDTAEPRQSRKRSPAFTPPDWIPIDSWRGYLASRRSKKHPMNAEALALCVKSIEKTMAAGFALDAIMEALVETGWRTVTPKYMANRCGGPDSGPGGGKPESHADRARRIVLGERSDDPFVVDDVPPDTPALRLVGGA